MLLRLFLFSCLYFVTCFSEDNQVFTTHGNLGEENSNMLNDLENPVDQYDQQIASIESSDDYQEETDVEINPLGRMFQFKPKEMFNGISNGKEILEYVQTINEALQDMKATLQEFTNTFSEKLDQTESKFDEQAALTKSIELSVLNINESSLMMLYDLEKRLQEEDEQRFQITISKVESLDSQIFLLRNDHDHVEKKIDALKSKLSNLKYSNAEAAQWIVTNLTDYYNLKNLTTAINNWTERQNNVAADISRELNNLKNSSTCLEKKNGKHDRSRPVVGLQNTNCSSDVLGTSPRDCYDILRSGCTISGIYNIYPNRNYGEIKVYCDMETDGGGWTVIQRRDAQFKPRINFLREWSVYRNGFGLRDQEFWLGLNNINVLTSSKSYTLRVDLGDFENETRYAEYSTFFVGLESDHYRLNIGGYSGDAGDAMSGSKGKLFSTADQDNDSMPNKNAAKNCLGAWWFTSDCTDCASANLNGFHTYEGPNEAQINAIFWHNWRGCDYSLRTTEMKIRPTSPSVNSNYDWNLLLDDYD